MGGGAWISGGAMRDCIVTNNQANLYGGGLRITGNSVVERVRVERNTSGFSGKTDRNGGGIYQTGGNVTACVLANNRAYGPGGGVSQTGGKLMNSLVVSNTATTGAGHAVHEAGGLLLNCTLADNSYGTAANGLQLTSGAVTNTIVWFNGTNDVSKTGGTIAYSCWSNAPAGNGNLSANPLVRNRGAANYTLDSRSPCINAGTTSLWTLADTDLDGNPRIRNHVVDIGAYEGLLPAGTILIVQ